MLLYLQTWLPLVTVTLTAAIFFSVALFLGACKALATIEDEHRECTSAREPSLSVGPLRGASKLPGYRNGSCRHTSAPQSHRRSILRS